MPSSPPPHHQHHRHPHHPTVIIFLSHRLQHHHRVLTTPHHHHHIDTATVTTSSPSSLLHGCHHYRPPSPPSTTTTTVISMPPSSSRQRHHRRPPSITYVDREKVYKFSSSEVTELFKRIISRGRRIEEFIQKKLDDLKDNHKFRGGLRGINTAPSTSSTNDVNTAGPQVSTASPNVNTASPQVSTVSFSDNVVYAFMVKNPNGSNLLHQNLEQIHEDDLEAMDLKWQLSLLSMRAKRWDTLPGNVEHQEARKNEVLFSEEDAVLKREVAFKDYEINVLKSEFEKVKQEKEGIEFKIKKFNKASKDLDRLLESQITDKSKKGLGYSVVPPPHPLIYNRPKKLDLSYSSLDEFKEPEFKGYDSEDSKKESNVVCDKKGPT
ncbi:hypothetical protein Tco_0643872 [Tanacetum coccineum]